MLDKIGLNGGEIETLFVERIAQLLKPKGIAAVILPSSILSNESASYTGAREQLLKNFYIRGIVAFGSKTFGATGTNTVVLFLEKFNEPPKFMNMVADSVEAILNGNKLDEWQDKEVLESYVAQIEQDLGTYKAFLKKEFSLAKLSDIEYFRMYCLGFADSTEIKNLEKTKTYKGLSEEKRDALYLEKLYAYIRRVEAEKLYYFALVYKQKTVIIKAPADNNEQKKFLGYDWSKRKGNEGIQINTAGGKMYNDSDREKEGTLAHAIRQSFNNLAPSFTKEQTNFGSVADTKDMLDYLRVGFSKAIKINNTNKVIIKSKYDLIKLKDFVSIVKGVTYDKEDQEYTPTSKVVLTADNITLDGKFDVVKKIYIKESKFFPADKKLSKNDVFICFSSGSKKHVGKVAFIKENTDYYAGGFMGLLRSNDSICLPQYLYYVLNNSYVRFLIRNESGGSNINNLSNKIGYVSIPVPPIDIQNQIIAECEKIDEEYDTTRMSIETYRKKIEDLFNELDVMSPGGGS